MWNEETLCLRAGAAGNQNAIVDIQPTEYGLRYVGLEIFHVSPGARRKIASGQSEAALLPLSGSCALEIDGEEMELRGRSSVFEAVSDFAYLPIESVTSLFSESGGEFAVISTRASRRFMPQYGPADSIGVEIRGAGDATRQINNFLTPDAPLVVDKLMGVEVLTPGGNFSSYPPHKHDSADPATGEADLEEIYYFRFRDEGGYGLYRQYAADGEFDVTTIVRHNDAFLVPRGYHGPSVAVPGHDMYFLNVLAGPGPERTMQYVDDPRQHWIRGCWLDDAIDHRLPLTRGRGAHGHV